MQQKINDTVICLGMGKNLTAKTLSGDFQVTIITTNDYKQGISSTLPTYS